ncbi:MAG TPA: large conductance mechanosensitive channel protein MscL [Candidatus Paceibacterota bacterium]
MLGEFKEFAIKGSVVDLAVGVVVGAAFNQIVNSFVKDIVTPPIGALLNGIDFSTLYINLSRGDYGSLKAAQEAGAATLNYGLFLNALISFLITAWAIFLVVKLINKVRRKEQENPEKTATERACPYCFTKISIKATRCPQCTSQL